MVGMDEIEITWPVVKDVLIWFVLPCAVFVALGLYFL